MATLDECRTVVNELIEKLAAVEPAKRKKHLPDRTLELRILDHDTCFQGRMHEGELIDVVECEESGKPDLRVALNSDDLISMTNGQLKFAHAWATGRVRLDASFRDLLRLRRIL